MDSTVARKAKIIFDSPASTDAFDGGGHLRCATALAESIEQLSNRDGAIGLEGAWGSGKSSVINFAKEALQKYNRNGYEYHLFTFDLWEHQSDDFRRAFLEEFVNWLRRNDHLNPKEVKRAKDKIRDRVKTVRSYNSKEYNFFGASILILTPLIPIIYSWMSPAALSINSIKNPLSSDVWFYCLLLFLLLYVIFLLRTGYHFLKPEYDEDDNKVKTSSWVDKLNNATSRSLSMFSKNVDKEVITQNIREADPTTIEFHGIFRNLLSKVQKKDKRLVFILDNIDRLPEDQVPNIWSEVRSLFSNSSFENDEKDSYVTAVIPYDKKFIQQAFKPTGQNNKESEGDIISKTFDVILHVTPPVATDWRKFLENQLNSAFDPDLEEQTIFRLFNLLRYHFQQKSIHPTPRRIISYVNEISALYMQWDPIISPESMALYILHRPLIENNPKALQDADLVSDRYLQIAYISSDWQKDFAALSFNVHPDSAYQILLQQPIINAFNEATPDQLLDLSKSKHGFNEIFIDSLDQALEDWTHNDVNFLSNAAKNIDALKLTGELKNAAWRRMTKALKELEKFNVNSPDSYDGIFAILVNQNSSDKIGVGHLIRAKLINSADTKSENVRELGINWLNSIIKIADVIEEENGKEAQQNFLKETQVPSSVEFCIGVAYACAETKKLKLTDLSLRTPKEEIQKGFSSQDIEDSAQSFKEALNQVLPFMDDETRAQYLEMINRSLSEAQKNSSETEALLEAYTKLYFDADENEKVKPHLENIVYDGTLAWYGHQETLNENVNFNVISLVQFLIVSINHGRTTINLSAQHATFGDLEETKKWYESSITEDEINDLQISRIAQLISAFGKFSTWTPYAINEDPKQRFFKSMLFELIKQGTYKRLDYRKLISEYPQIKAILDDAHSTKLLEKFSEWSKYFDTTIIGNEIYKIPDEFIKDICNLAKKEQRDKYDTLLNNIDTHLRSFTQENWEEAFIAEDDRIRILLVRRETQDISLPIESYRPALLTHATKVLEGKLAPKQYKLQWHQILSGLKEGNRINLAADLFGKLSEITINKKNCELFIKLYKELAHKMPYTSDPDRALNKIFSKILSSTDLETKNFINDISGIIKECIGNASDVSKKAFIETIESLEETGIEENEEWAKKLRLMFGMQAREQSFPTNDHVTEEPEKKKQE